MTDLISRQDAIARIQALMEKEKFGSEFRIPFLDAIGAIADMPSAETPDRCETGTEARDLLRYKP